MCVFCHVYIQYFDLRHQQESVLHRCVCVCAVFLALGIMPCSHVRRVTEPEEGIDDFRPPPPFFPLPVFLSPSFLPWSICLLGRQEGLLFWHCFPRPEGRLCPRAVFRPGWKRHRQFFSSEGPSAQGIKAVCLFLVKAPREFPELTNSYTQPRSNRAEKLLDLQILGWPLRNS